MTKDQISNDMKAAMKAGDKLRVSTLRLLLSEIKYGEIQKKAVLTEEEIMGVVSREIKKRREAIPQYVRGGRPELAEKEESEAAILQEYLPEQLSGEELGRLVDEAISAAGAADAKELGKVMSILMPKIKGRADGAAVSALVRQRLGA